uniref:Uncharacterized protein n=1 Tax=Anopheles christyi TaxID=43041 RepID=A0A182KBJ0_9DIPT
MPTGQGEKADLKSRSDSTSVPPLDSIYTTPTGFHHHHHHPHHAAHHPHQNGTPGSPEAMKTPNSETDCGTVKESLTDDASTADTSSPLQDGACCEGIEPLAASQPETTFAASRTGPTVEADGRCVCEDSSPGRSSGRSHDRAQGQCASQPAGTRLVTDGGSDGVSAPNNNNNRPDQTKVRLPAKASDYGLERFNRLLDRLDRGNFLIKTSFKKSYSLILMSARGSLLTGDASAERGVSGGVESSGNDSTTSTNTNGTGDSKTNGSGPAGAMGCNSSSISNSSNSSTGGPTDNFKRLQHQAGKGPGMGGSLRGWGPRTRGILIKANSSTGIYELAGRSVAGEQTDNATAHRSPTEKRASGQGQPVPVPDPPETAPTNATITTTTTTTSSSGHNYNGNSLTSDGEHTGKGEKGQQESDELCRSEVYDNDSGSGGQTTDQRLNNNRSTTQASPRKQANVEPMRNNYENIRPSAHRQRLASLDSASHTLGSGYRKPTGRKKSNAASTGSEWDEDSAWVYAAGGPDDEAEHQLSSSFPHTSSEYYWQSAECAVPTRFFQRQDYVQPASTDTGPPDFPPDRSNSTSLEGDQASERGNKRTLGRKRWLGSKGSKSKALSSLTDHGTNGNTTAAVTVGNKDSVELPFQLTSSLFTGPHSGTQGRKRSERVPQLKNINLHFPNKTSHHPHHPHPPQQQHQMHGYGIEQPQHELRSSRAPMGTIPPGALFHQPTGYQQLSLPPQTVAACQRQGPSTRGERKYFNKAKTHFLKLGQKWRLLSVSGSKPRPATTHRGAAGHQQPISSYNLDDLIKATHRYGQENESANLSQKIVYKSYKSELDLTKNLAYLDSFLNEHFEQDGDRQRTVGRYSRHKRAKSCSKTLDPSLKVAALGPSAMDEDPGTDSTLEAVTGTVPCGRTTSNLIQLEDVWDGTGAKGRGGGHWVATNTSSSSSEYLRNNLSTARTKPNVRGNKMRDFFRFEGAAGGADDALYGMVTDGGKHEDDDEEENLHPQDEDDDDEDEEEDEEEEEEDDDDARMLLFDSLASYSGGPGNVVAVGTASARTIEGALVEHYGKNNATSSSLSSSDYASVYSATSSGGTGAPAGSASGKQALHGTQQFKLLATPEETASGGGDYSPPKQHQCSPKKQRSAHQHQSRVHLAPSNNTTNPFVTLSTSEGPAGSATHRIYNNFLDGSPSQQPASLSSLPGSPSDRQRVEKNHRLLRKLPAPSSSGRLPSTGTVSPRATDRYDYRVQPKPSNSQSHFRPMASTVLDTDLTYQEDYLEHYQNAARSRTTLGEPNDTDRSMRLLHRELYHRRNVLPVVGGSNGEDLQNNALANEHSDNDSDEDGAQERALAKVGDVDDVVTNDELLLLVNAAIDIRRSQAVEQPLQRKKHFRKGVPSVQHRLQVANEPLSDGESVANEHKTLLAYRPHTQLPYEVSSNQLLTGEFRSGVVAEPATTTVGGARRSFAGLNHPTNGGGQPASSKTVPTNSYLGYGPHRVIVSQSRKERGEVVLEYEC